MPDRVEYRPSEINHSEYSRGRKQKKYEQSEPVKVLYLLSVVLLKEFYKPVYFIDISVNSFIEGLKDLPCLFFRICFWKGECPEDYRFYLSKPSMLNALKAFKCFL